jgi:hypothetical protein
MEIRGYMKFFSLISNKKENINMKTLKERKRLTWNRKIENTRRGVVL